MSSELPSYDNYFIRHSQLPDIGESGQHLLNNSFAVIFGAGALGLPVLQSLLMSGIGRILLIDPDVVDLSNLHRQFVYSAEDVGTFKVDCASTYARSFPHSKVATLAADVTDNLEKVLQRTDIVFECTDSHKCKQAVNDACKKLDIPAVFGGLYQSHGTVHVVGQKGGCYRCIAQSGNAADCADAGVFAPFSMLVGTMQANVGLRHLLNKNDAPASGTQLMIDGASMNIRKLHVPMNKQCQVCGDAQILSLENEKVTDATLRTGVIVLKKYTDSRKDSLTELKEPEDVLLWTPETDVETYIVACATGSRANTAAAILQNKGFENVQTMSLAALNLKL